MEEQTEKKDSFMKKVGKFLFGKAEKQETDRKVLSFFLIAFPTLLIIAMAKFYPNTIWIWIALAVYQFVMLKTFMEKYYEVF